MNEMVNICRNQINKCINAQGGICWNMYITNCDVIILHVIITYFTLFTLLHFYFPGHCTLISIQYIQYRLQHNGLFSSGVQNRQARRLQAEKIKAKTTKTNESEHIA